MSTYRSGSYKIIYTNIAMSIEYVGSVVCSLHKIAIFLFEFYAKIFLPSFILYTVYTYSLRIYVYIEDVRKRRRRRRSSKLLPQAFSSSFINKWARNYLFEHSPIPNMYTPSLSFSTYRMASSLSEVPYAFSPYRSKLVSKKTLL